jgi:hypothetical protein
VAEYKTNAPPLMSVTDTSGVTTAAPETRVVVAVKVLISESLRPGRRWIAAHLTG